MSIANNPLAKISTVVADFFVDDAAKDDTVEVGAADGDDFLLRLR